MRWYADHGFWGVKIYNSMNPDFVKPIAAEAHRLGLHVSGHVPAFMTSERAIADGYDEINHINQLLLMFVMKDKEDPRTPFRFTVIGERLKDLDTAGAAFQRVLGLMKQRKITLDPTLAVFDSLLAARPGKGSPVDSGWLDHVPAPVQRDRRSLILDIKPEQYPTYEASLKKQDDIIALLHREGIPMVPGTDDIAGLALHSELESWVHAGISPRDTLTAATLGGARFLGLEAELGTIAVGKRADLYLVDGDPLADIRNIRKGRLVVKDGAFYFPDEMLAAMQISPFARHAGLQISGARHACPALSQGRYTPPGVRLFLAGVVPDALKESLHAQLESVRVATPQARWLPPEGLHLTLVFLGSVPEQTVPALREAFGGVCSRHPPMSLTALRRGDLRTALARRGSSPSRSPARWRRYARWSATRARRRARWLTARAASGRSVRTSRSPAHARPTGDLLLGRCRTALGHALDGGFVLREVALMRSETLATGAVHTELAALDARRLSAPSSCWNERGEEMRVAPRGSHPLALTLRIAAVRSICTFRRSRSNT